VKQENTVIPANPYEEFKDYTYSSPDYMNLKDDYHLNFDTTYFDASKDSEQLFYEDYLKDQADMSLNLDFSANKTAEALKSSIQARLAA
jgi:hypothetical protein